jgi:hypothetical protein
MASFKVLVGVRWGAKAATGAAQKESPGLCPWRDQVVKGAENWG